jgi:hypothetical protein
LGGIAQEVGMEYTKKERVTALDVLADALLLLIYVIPNHIDLDQEFELTSLGRGGDCYDQWIYGRDY